MAFLRGAEQPDASAKPLVSFVGANTHFTRNQYQRISNEDSWIRFWLRHKGKAGTPETYSRYQPSGAPKINFEQCMVVAITHSPGQLNAGIQCMGYRVTKKQLTFDFENSYYQSRAGTSAPGNAYGYFVVPRSTKPIVFRCNVQNRLSRESKGPEWKVLAKLPALEDENAPRDKPVAVNFVFGYDPGAGKYDGVLGKPNDAWNFVPSGTRTMQDVRSSKDHATNLTLHLSENDGTWGIPDQSGIFHGYIYHNCRCVDLKATLTGLAPGRYRLLVFAHGDAPDQNAKIELVAGGEKYPGKTTVNDGSSRFRSTEYEEGVHFVSFEFDATSDDAVQIVSKRDGSDYSMFNAIQIAPVMKRR